MKISEETFSPCDINVTGFSKVFLKEVVGYCEMLVPGVERISY